MLSYLVPFPYFLYREVARKIFLYPRETYCGGGGGLAGYNVGDDLLGITFGLDRWFVGPGAQGELELAVLGD
jgi:hypothetical protein